MTTFKVEDLDEVLLDIKNTLIKKNEAYGKNNIAKFGEKGVFIRVNDKYERLFQLVWEGKAEPQDETVMDTWRDMAGYSVIAMMLRKGKW
jgi:hypothetical protein